MACLLRWDQVTCLGCWGNHSTRRGWVCSVYGPAERFSVRAVLQLQLAWKGQTTSHSQSVEEHQGRCQSFLHFAANYGSLALLMVPCVARKWLLASIGGGRRGRGWSRWVQTVEECGCPSQSVLAFASQFYHHGTCMSTMSVTFCCGAVSVFEKKRNVRFKRGAHQKFILNFVIKLQISKHYTLKLIRPRTINSMNHVQLEEPPGKKLWGSTLDFMLSLGNIFYVFIHHQK